MAEVRRVHTQIRMGVIGCGQFMSRQHIQTIARSQHLQLCHLGDSDPAALERVSARYGPERTTSQWRDVVGDPEVDVVVAGIVPTFHPDIVRACLEAGKPLYVEKPVTETLAEGQALAAQARQAGVSVAVGFNRRFAPAVQLVREAVQGAARPMTLTYRISDDARVRPPAQRWKLGDRLLIEAVHVFDLLFHLVGAEPVRLYASESRPNDAVVLISFADGSQAVVYSSSFGSMSQCKEHLEAVLDGAVLEMDDFVEVRGHGPAGIPPRSCFAGRPYDGCDNGHVEAFAARGAAAYTELRERYTAAMESSGVLQDSGSDAAWERFAELAGDPPWPQINYCPDKGWGSALEAFCRAAMAGETPTNAGLVDICRATACALAARQSIESGVPVDLGPTTWADG